MTSSSVQRLYEPQVRAFVSTVESEDWKSDHDHAMRCRDLEAVIRIGVKLYDMLDEADIEIRLENVRGERDDGASLNAVLDALFDWWLQPCPKVEQEIRELEAKGYEVEGADEFRRRCHTAHSARNDR